MSARGLTKAATQEDGIAKACREDLCGIRKFGSGVRPEGRQVNADDWHCQTDNRQPGISPRALD